MPPHAMHAAGATTLATQMHDLKFEIGGPREPSAMLRYFV